MKLFADHIVEVLEALENGWGEDLGLAPDTIEVTQREITFYSNMMSLNVQIFWSDPQQVYQYGTFLFDSKVDGGRVYDLEIQENARMEPMLKLLKWVYEK